LPDCDEHIDVTDALKNLVVENGESQVRVTVKGSPDYASAGPQCMAWFARLPSIRWRLDTAVGYSLGLACHC
jgi:hypothetical protein